MEQRRQSLFDDLEISEARTHRAIERIDQQLICRGVAALQRAVITLLVAHHDARIVRGEIQLAINLADAADWMVEFAPAARGMRCCTSSVRRSLEAWRRAGVLNHAQVGPCRRIVLSQWRFTEWLESSPDFEDLAMIFSVPDGSKPEQAGASGGKREHAGASGGKPEQAGASEFNESMNEESSIIPEDEPQRAPPPGKTSKVADSSSIAMGRVLSELPPLPDEVWLSRSDGTTFSLVRTWWDKHELGNRFDPQQAEAVGATVLGLIEAAKRARDPAAFFHSSKATPAHYLETNGRKFLKRIAASRPPRDAVVEDVARRVAERRAKAAREPAEVP